ncbi:MAG TPA: GNAT family N-acetyltransferase [Bryobacteraceae bacterium]|nr:GNAT family N-acetyltransferase [Bryobacteraceae bacterium]
MTLTDIHLGRRLERAEAAGCAGFVEARARLFPDSGAQWIDVGGTWAMFDGVDSPITQSFGLGMFEPATAAGLDTIEAFFRRRGATPHHEVSPLAGKDLAVFLSARGYEPFELTSVLHRPMAPPDPAVYRTNRISRISIVNEQDADVFVATSVRGWSEYVEYAGLIRDLARVGVARRDAVSFLAELEGEPAATASLTIHQGVALMAGASTVPEARNQGLQRALLEARLRYAAEAGCDLAMICAEPGSASQRNAERAGFRIAYTRMKWRPRASA